MLQHNISDGQDIERSRQRLRERYQPDSRRTPEMRVIYVTNRRGRIIACLAHSEAEAMEWAQLDES